MKVRVSEEYSGDKWIDMEDCDMYTVKCCIHAEDVIDSILTSKAWLSTYSTPIMVLDILVITE